MFEDAAFPALKSASLSGGAGGNAGPSRSMLDMMGATSGMFDSSGWNVATGRSKASGTAGSVPWLYIAIGAGLLGLLLWKKR